MRKIMFFFLLLCAGGLSSITLSAQITVSGKVRNNVSQEAVPAVSVIVKGTSQGTYTNADGQFSIQVEKLPAILVFTSVGFETYEAEVKDASVKLEIAFVSMSTLGQEVVVAATRTPTRILESPVTIERMSNAILRTLPAPNYYEGIANLKGVDMHTASLTFRTVTTRGFISSGNSRLNQLIDGMDNQAPGLNFSVGDIAGPTELDVDNVELLSGASSALYGSGGMNGTLLITSKNPFKYQGLSYNIKMGMMNIGNKSTGVTPYYNWDIRWAKAINDRWAYKLSASLLSATDWSANDNRNVFRTSIASQVISGTRTNNPNYDGVNVYGDETSANIRDLTLLLWQSLGSPAAIPVQTPAGVVNIPSSYFLNTANLPSQNVSRTGYAEKDLVDYNTYNFKFSGALHYKISSTIEASLSTNMGTGTTVYTGADRYSLRNFKVGQHKLEVRGKNWFVKGYTTQENAGDSYNATILGRYMNEAWKPSLNTTSPATALASWYPQYIFGYLVSKYTGLATTEAAAHQIARNTADAGRPLPGTSGFEALKDKVAKTAIPNGALLLDQSDLWAGEAQLNLSDAFGFSDKLEVITGVQSKLYVINSQGTIFVDTAGRIKVNETGGYIQLKKSFFDDVLTLTGAGRYDKHTNFDGRFTPRLTAVVKIAKDNNLRFSYQQAYRFPTNQNQFINLEIGGGLLIGGLPQFQTKYGLVNNPGYTSESIVAYRASGNPANTSLLVPYTYRPMKPESVTSFEFGYKGIMQKGLLVDAYVYYSIYKDFLGNVALGQAVTGNPADLFNPLTTAAVSYPQNSTGNVKAIGWGVGLEYEWNGGYTLYGNVFSDRLNDRPKGFVTFFNAPKYRFNVGLRNPNVYKNVGFNVVLKYQGPNFYEGTFVTGTLPEFAWLDAQVSYRIPDSKSLIRIGGTNITNSYNRTGYGSPYVGGLYYVSYGYNIF
jgi:outer membrane receptor protein involved in Fe transport